MSDPTLRAHSPLGASAAERYINCAGSVRLSEKLHPGLPSTESDYTRHGKAAHKVVARCLGSHLDVWEVLEEGWDGVVFSPAEVRSMQSFIDLVRERIAVFKRAYGGQSPTTFIEFPIQALQLHDLFYGTLDVGIVAGEEAEIIDYKHGAGVAVDIENNAQLQMYAIGFIQSVSEVRRVRMRIAQPRAFHPAGWDRSWEAPVEGLMTWFDDVLLPAMEEADPRNEPTEESKRLNPGEWCRFCPVRRQCPALARQAVAVNEYNQAGDYTNEELGTLYAMLPTVRMKIAAIEEEVHRRNLADPTSLVPGTKLVAGRSKRIWKEGAEIEIAKVYGSSAYVPATLMSPYALEQEHGPNAKKLTKLHAYSPDAGYGTAPISDKRKAITLQKPVDAYHLEASQDED